MLLSIVYAMLFVDTVDTGVYVMRCENSTLLCIQWPQILSMLTLSIQNTSTHFCP